MKLKFHERVFQFGKLFSEKIRYTLKSMTVLVGSVITRFNLFKSDGSLLGLVLFQILCFVKNLTKMHKLFTKYLRECMF